MAMALINSYPAPTELFIDGELLYSNEDTIQGDPLAMPMYALATIPLIRKLQHHLESIIIVKFGLQMMPQQLEESPNYVNGGMC